MAAGLISRPRLRAGVTAAVSCLLLTGVACAATWKMQYFYDYDRETLALNDLKCPTSRRCIATGAIDSDKGTSHPPPAVGTSDGGAPRAGGPRKEQHAS